MGYINGAASDPLRVLDTQLSGYLLAIAIAAVLPALRLALDRAVLTVRLPVVCAMLRISEACAGDAMQACHAWCSCFKQGMGSLQACRRKAVYCTCCCFYTGISVNMFTKPAATWAVDAVSAA